jgi:putative protease
MKNPRNPQVEIMAPAGSYESLSAAIRSGADSVYFGVDKLNMRSRSASPFMLSDLHRIARICRWCGVRSYLALNVIVYDEEIADMREICDAAKAAGISAVIAADISAIQYARSIDLEVHISTQSNVSNLEAARFFAQYADVVVLARELKLEQIRYICDQIKEQHICGPSGNLLEVELFVHGALCVAISGKCGMSLSAYNSSANRGACFQSCRRRYKLEDLETGEEFVLENQFVMSPKDLCTVMYLDRITGAGCRVLKLEGRGRSADYVATVTSVYREAVDHLYETQQAEQAWPAEGKLDDWMKRLHSVFNRGFWEGGYYCGKQVGEWATASNSKAEKLRMQLGRVTNYFSKMGIVEFKCHQPNLNIGDELLFIGESTGAVEFKIESMRVDGEPAESAKMHDIVTVPAPIKVRRGDKVFLLVERGEDGRTPKNPI